MVTALGVKTRPSLLLLFHCVLLCAQRAHTFSNYSHHESAYFHSYLSGNV